MSLPLIFTPEATQDVLNAYRYHKKIDQELADKFNLSLKKEVNLIETFPESSPKVYKNFRRLILHTFSYAVFYTIEATHIRIFCSDSSTSIF